MAYFAVAAVPAVTLPAAVPALSQPGGPSRTHCRDGSEGALLLHQPGASRYSFLCPLPGENYDENVLPGSSSAM